MKRLAYLDALRGIAALLVVFTHSLPLMYPGHIWLFDVLFDPGKLGVLWFFMISGVVIPYSLRPGPDGARHFVVSRFMRLYPAYWLSLLAWLAMLRLTGGPLPPWTQIVANLSMVQAALGFEDVIGLYWTLFIELVFYALCLLLFLSGRLYELRVRRHFALAALAVALVMAAARAISDSKLPVALPLALSLMFSGSIWRQWLLAEHSAELARSLRHLLLGYTLLLPPTLILGYNTDMGTGESWGRYLFTYVLALSSFLLLTQKWRLNHPLLVWLGGISYSLYLLHPSLLLLSQYLFGAGALAALSTLILSLGAAHLCFRYLETPFIQLGQRLNQRHAKTHAARA
ncbi:acyltransferase family protein [Pseudomonas sp. Pseusp122]|uniref:acyltransferase family protein n=1 Tax=unclassified Pseudomonas TaxID=196821 RepID=UPI0039A639DE